jgi:hypothetical protein
MLPKCVLATSRRAGKRNRGDNQTVSDLCAAWDRDELRWLWNRATSRNPASSTHSVNPKRVLETAVQHARQGRLGKACATLSSSGLAPNSDLTTDLLSKKHPQCDPPEPVDVVATPPLQLDAVFDLPSILSSFSKNVGTDGTNFRVQHLIDAAEAHLPLPYLPRLKKVINILLRGSAPADIQRCLAGARLTALAKGGDDVRPIAAGNIFRRIASKCACFLLHSRAQAAFAPLQVGVAFRGGAEQIIHSTIYAKNFSRTVGVR